MIHLHFHWSWLLIAAVLIATAVLAYPNFKQGGDSIGQAVSSFFGVIIVVFGLLVAAVIAGIFIW